MVKSHYYVLRDQRTGELIRYMDRCRFYDDDLDEITEFLREARLDNPNWLLYRNCEIVTKQGYHFLN